MGDSTQLVNYIELYVNSAATPSQQAASVDAIATLLKNDLLTLEALVREMEMYLTTTDSIIRARGILLLAELLEQLAAKPLNSTSIHSLIGFFTERLSDWKALHGALVGCLALLRRNIDVGKATDAEAKAVAQSYLQNLQVQSLGLHDRKLSFQIMDCLLDRYAGAIRDLGDNLVYGICEAIDGEKDPQCLLLVFHIVESLALLYPDPSGPLVNYAEDLFGFLECYFPIHFTHSKGQENDHIRGELSKALMLAFASTPVLEPFSVPLLLDKLSSSLPAAKVESFRYLSYCTPRYGPDRMAKHTQALWSSVKDATFNTPECTLSMESPSMGGMSFQDSDIMAQAFLFLQEVVQQDAGFIGLIIVDKDINIFLNSLNQYQNFDDIPLQVKQRLHVVGHILSMCAKQSIALCNKVFESFFLRIMGFLGVSVAKSPESSHQDDGFALKHNFGALYLCIELLEACNYLTADVDYSITLPDFANQTWCSMLSSFSASLARAFIFLTRLNAVDNAQNIFFGVKGLQTLATFPGRLPVSNSIYETILVELVSFVISDSNKTFLWDLALKTLVEIGFFVDKFPDSEKAASYKIIVLEKIVSLISLQGSAVPSSLKLKAAFDIGSTRKDFMLRVVQGLDEALFTSLFAVYDNGNLGSDELVVKLLDLYANKVLPWFIEIGDSEEIALNFALGIWDKIEKTRPFNLCPPEIATDLLDTLTIAIKKAVVVCNEGSQEIIINKAFGVLFSDDSFGLMGLESGVCRAQQTHNFGNSCRDEWLTSLFASVVIALHPQTSIPNRKMVLQLFIQNLLGGHIPSAQALGSLVNKLPLKVTEMDLSKRFSLDEVLEAIFLSGIGPSGYDSTSGNEGSEIDFCSLRSNIGIQSKSNTVTGLAWIGKGLLMRGHEKVKDVTMTLLSFLTLDWNGGVSIQLENLIEVSNEEDKHQLMKCAADAFHIIMSDSEACLNRQYHATIRPLYKQRFFSTIMPIFLSLVQRYESTSVRSMLYRAIAHVISDTPLTAIFGEANKMVPVLLDCLSMLSKDIQNKELIYNVLLVIAGILVDKSGQEAATENASRIVNQLIELTGYPHVMAIRETAIQCLVAMSQLMYTRIYPLRTQVLRATLKALDDPKRVVRQEAVRCRQAWASIASRSLQF